MRQTILSALVAGVFLPFPALAAESADLAAIRAQIAEMKQAYEQRIAALEGKLAAAERQAAPATAPVAATAASEPAVRRSERGSSAASAFNPEVSLILQGQYTQMKNVAGRGITGFWPAAGHGHGGNEIEAANRRGFNVDHSELVLSANIDPNWRGQAILAMRDREVEVEEAWFQSLGLGNGFGVKGGRFRSGIGYLNEQHPHQWDFAGAPLMYSALFGEHGSYVQDGVQAKWLAPTPFFLEFGAETGRGASFPGSERNRNGAGSGAVFAHLGNDLGDSHSWRAGLSYLKSATRQRLAEVHDANDVHGEAGLNAGSKTWIADFVWKWAPNGNPKYRNFKLQGEYFSRSENGDIGCTPETAGSGEACTGLRDSYRRRQEGWYLQAVYQFTPNWRAGLRHEQLAANSARIGTLAAAELGNENALFKDFTPKRSSAMIDYSWSEFSRVRLQYAQDKSMQGLTDHQWTLQYIMSLGAHGAHKF